MEGRTGRIGNVGVASSFYNERDADIAEVLVKTLLETKQAIPDFLQHHIPTGFTPDGEGDAAELKFDDSSDNGDGEAGGDGGDGAQLEGGTTWGDAPAADPVHTTSAGAASFEDPEDPWGVSASSATPAAPAAENSHGGW